MAQDTSAGEEGNASSTKINIGEFEEHINLIMTFYESNKRQISVSNVHQAVRSLRHHAAARQGETGMKFLEDGVARRVMLEVLHGRLDSRKSAMEQLCVVETNVLKLIAVEENPKVFANVAGNGKNRFRLLGYDHTDGFKAATPSPRTVDVLWNGSPHKGNLLILKQKQQESSVTISGLLEEIRRLSILDAIFDANDVAPTGFAWKDVVVEHVGKDVETRKIAEKCLERALCDLEEKETLSHDELMMRVGRTVEASYAVVGDLEPAMYLERERIERVLEEYREWKRQCHIDPMRENDERFLEPRSFWRTVVGKLTEWDITPLNPREQRIKMILNLVTRPREARRMRRQSVMLNNQEDRSGRVLDMYNTERSNVFGCQQQVPVNYGIPPARRGSVANVMGVRAPTYGHDAAIAVGHDGISYNSLAAGTGFGMHRDVAARDVGGNFGVGCGNSIDISGSNGGFGGYGARNDGNPQRVVYPSAPPMGGGGGGQVGYYF